MNEQRLQGSSKVGRVPQASWWLGGEQVVRHTENKHLICNKMGKAEAC